MSIVSDAAVAALLGRGEVTMAWESCSDCFWCGCCVVRRPGRSNHGRGSIGKLDFLIFFSILSPFFQFFNSCFFFPTNFVQMMMYFLLFHICQPTCFSFFLVFCPWTNYYWNYNHLPHFFHFIQLNGLVIGKIRHFYLLWCQQYLNVHQLNLF